MKQQDAEQAMVEGCFTMLGWRIFLHSVQMVLRNWRHALRLGLVPAILGSLATLALAWVTQSGPAFEQFFGAGLNDFDKTEITRQHLLFSLLVIVLQSVAGLWIVITWHRFILLEEAQDGWVPPLRPGRILAYLALSIGIGLICAAVALPVVFASAALAVALGARGMGEALTLAAFLLLSPWLQRLLLVLPASAIGQPLSFGDALRLTRGQYWTMLGVAALGFAMQYGLSTVLSFVGGVSTVGPVAALFLTLLLQSLFGASILTTLYGVFVEKRPVG
ncbi:hypothetical protein KBY28_02550 [Ruegeria pomeroyi]|uniref:hypothetical protein n=1 Tax=Ruegeria pomeroyi TaxID=89184 RepID=UPI001F1BDE2F|nr:hypothetical protein [Ruegeria pomeroyi]MCE8507321.1 hypothetical protein [Ruegeria pomeroyi]